MFKKPLIGFALLTVIIVAVIYFAGSSVLNKGIKSGVETYGPRVTQTPVTLEDVQLSILSGSGMLKGLHVGNPEGYKSENIFALGQIDLKVNTRSVFSDKIIIDHIIIKRPAISYEKKLTTSNLKKLLENIEQFTGPSSEPEAETAEEEKAGTKKQVIIKKLLIEDGTIYVGALGIGQTVPLPRIEMENIGEDGNEMTMPEVIDLVLSQVLQSIGPAIASAGELGGAAVDVLKTQGLDKVGQATDLVGEGIKGLFGK
ncbi:MAG: hypothetical protein ISR40_08695 [Puniceicoccaceae bacterium]|nr:hypothetical protein [Puniceicoccaceae bacterium]